MMLQALITMMRGRWPDNKRVCPDVLKSYWNVRDSLVEYEGIVFKDQQLVIPSAMRQLIMREIHSGHFGIVKCLERARAAVYWPGYTQQIRVLVESCSLCQENRRASKYMPLQPHNVPDYPYQVVGTDLLEIDGQMYLLSVDYYSKWVCGDTLHETCSVDVIRETEKHFVDFGIPEKLVTAMVHNLAALSFDSSLKD